MKRTLVIAVGVLAVLAAAIGTTSRLRETRLTLHAALLRLGIVVGLDAEDIEFQSAGDTLSGTIVFPLDSEPAAGLVVIHGSGPATRMLWLAQLFASEGIAVLTYDKRGVRQSGGKFIGGMGAATEANFDLLARDASAAAAVLAHHPRLRHGPVGFVGFSQGGWIGPMAAAMSPDASYMTFFSGPVATVCEEGRFSELAEGDSRFWQTHTREEVAEYMALAACPVDDVDPRPTLAQLSLPGFWAFGEQDNIMPVDLSVARLDKLISDGQSQFSYRVYPENGHELVLFDFSRLSLSAAFHDTADWIKRTAARQAASLPDR